MQKKSRTLVTVTLAVNAPMARRRKVIARKTYDPTHLEFTADLHQIIRSGQKLSNEHAQYFIYQVLRGE